VTVDALITEGTGEEKVAQTSNSKNKNNQIIITAMADCFVWFTAAAIYANAVIQKKDANILWIVFVWAIPVTFLVTAVLAYFFWKRSVAFYISTSLFVWTLFLAFFLHFFYIDSAHQPLWYIFIAAIPIQVMIILFTKLK
jgi:small-conductance mechanosensitive channel